MKRQVKNAKKQQNPKKNGNNYQQGRYSGDKSGKVPRVTEEETKGNSTVNQRRAKEIDDNVERMYKSTRNAFEWYNRFEQYTKYAGTIPFGIPSGMSLPLVSNTINGKNTIPGIMSLYFIPSIGYSADRNSPINRSAVRWYSMLRRAQKASADYDSQDMMMAYMAIDSLAMFHEVGKRIIGIANLNSVLNRYVPEGLLKAMHVDPIDVRDNIADWWGYVNKFAIDAGNVTMPKDIDLRDRHGWMCSGLYTDAAQERSQIYMFVPLGFWQYNNTVSTGSQLDWIQWPTDQSEKLMTLADYKVMGNALLNAVFADEDMATISGDTQNAIGVNSCYHFEQITSNYTIDALYSEIVLSQIENSRCCGPFASTYTPVITQNPSVNNGAILYTPIHYYANNNETIDIFNHNKYLLNFHMDNPQVENVIEATRLTTIGQVDQSTGLNTPTAFGSEVIAYYMIWKTSPNDAQEFLPILGGFYNDFLIDLKNYSGSQINQRLEILASLEAFDWHPILYIWVLGPDGKSLYMYPQLDYDTTGLLDSVQLSNMHDAALTSEFAVPEALFGR